MKIGIVAATRFEIQPTIDFLYKHNFLFQSHHFEILITGIGAIAATYVLSNYACHQKPEFIMQAGIGGSFTKSFPPCQVVAIKEEVMGDVGVEENNDFRDIFDIGLLKPSESPFNDKRLANPYLAAIELAGISLASGITVNEVTTRTQRIKQLMTKYNCEIESMEGAALHYVCLREKISFIQFRAVSNYVGERDKTKWKLKEAVENLNQKLIHIIPQIFPA